jgi:subfamily B ATP-binding cassette protein MsbA
MNQPSTLRRILSLILVYWPMLLISTIAALSFVVFNSASVWITATMINNILIDFDQMVKENALLLSSESLSINDHLKLLSNRFLLKNTALETVWSVSVALVFVFGLKNIALYIKNISLSIAQYRLLRDLRNRLYAHFHYLSLAYFNKNKSGELGAILIADIENMKSSFGSTFQKMFVEPLNIATILTLLFIIDSKIALLALVIVPVSGIVIYFISNSIRRRSRRSQNQLAGISAIVSETLRSMRIVKAFVMKNYEISKFHKETSKYYSLMIKKEKIRLISAPINETLGAGVAAILLWIGANDVLVNQSISSEDFIRFILLLFSLWAPIKNLTNVVNEIQNGLASADRVFNILDIKSDINNIDNPSIKKSFNQSIDFKNVSFSYEKEEVLRKISFSASQGEIIAIVGSSGAGKSTLVDLIPRFYDVTDGEILIDGENIKHIELHSLRSLMGIVTQDTFLFNDTVAANISYGLEINQDIVEEAAKAANAHDFIMKLPEGYNSQIGENGISLSGGQRQRIAIARALIKNPPILILDEATSSLDTESEKNVQEAIEQLMKNRTVIVIAHRLSTINNADKIIVLDQGQIIDQGSHEKLIEKNSLYKELYNLQFQI